jgi:signal transduction histidine kinase
MTLATKLTLALWAGILLVHSAAAIVRVERESTLFAQDTAHDEQVLGRALSHAADRAWHNSSEEEAMAMLRHASAREQSMNIRWVWLDGDPTFTPPPVLARDARAAIGSSITLDTTADGEDAIVTYTPLLTPSGRLGAIEISDLLEDEKQYVRGSVVVAVVTSMLLAGLCALLAWALLTRWVKRPIQGLVAHAERIGAGDFSLRKLSTTQDEIATLSMEMNRMCERLRDSRDHAAAEVLARDAALDQLRHADRLKTVGTLASGIAHELGTPINVAEGHAQLAREDDLVSDETKRHLDVITRQCKRMAAIIRQLLDFARRGATAGGQCELEPVVRESASLMQALARKSQVELEFEPTRPQQKIAISLAPAQLQQVLLNLMINAIHAMPNGGTICVGFGTRRPKGASDSTPDSAFVEVIDSGVGMDQETVLRIFEPFFTTKQVGEGTGLGLSVAYGIVHDAGGSIAASSEPGRGSTFTITLPLAVPTEP